MKNDYLKKLNSIEPREIIKGFLGRLIHSENMTLAFWEIEKGSSLPEHYHVNEQIIVMQEGRFELLFNGKSIILEKGMVFVLPSNAPHAGKAITNCKILDVFSPVRSEYQ